MATIEFTGNYQDLSTDKGYQFKFFCEKCGNGYMSSFQTNKLGMAASAVEVANDLFGGIFGRAAASAYEVQRAVGGPAHDAALREAVDEIRPKFKQCTRCGRWVCEPVCWNHKAGLCENCAPDLEQELASAQAEAAREQVQSKAREVDWLKNTNVAEVTAVACASCGAKVGNAKFCPECGTPVKSKLTCRSCGATPEGNPKFCPECGQRF
jgi:hypothetical protein